MVHPPLWLQVQSGSEAAVDLALLGADHMMMAGRAKGMLYSLPGALAGSVQAPVAAAALEMLRPSGQLRAGGFPQRMPSRLVSNPGERARALIQL
jgi:hypothetical protein